MFPLIVSHLKKWGGGGGGGGGVEELFSVQKHVNGCKQSVCGGGVRTAAFPYKKTSALQCYHANNETLTASYYHHK